MVLHKGLLREGGWRLKSPVIDFGGNAGSAWPFGAVLQWKQLLSEPVAVMVPVYFRDSVVWFNLELCENSVVRPYLCVVLSVRGDGSG